MFTFFITIVCFNELIRKEDSVHSWGEDIQWEKKINLISCQVFWFERRRSFYLFSCYN